MDLLLQVVRWEVWIFLLALAGTVAFQLLTGRINTTNLLSRKLGGSRGDISPERVQLLATTLGAAFYYVMQAAAAAKSGKLPDVPETWPAVMGGSNLIYLGGKAYARFFANSDSK
ncbi:MAG TPA: hypothetical protein VMU45_00125 [Candidatus Eisenbacteria bacterium]|nr:hypothetical protein [Candidatus Eisenbacteria bacterium]